MALFAGTTERLFVCIVLCMAGIAGGRGFLLRYRNGVAAFTLRRFVLAQQRKFGVLVVIERGGLPVLIAVTGLAFLAKDALMVIVLLMT